MPGSSTRGPWEPADEEYSAAKESVSPYMLYEEEEGKEGTVQNP